MASDAALAALPSSLMWVVDEKPLMLAASHLSTYGKVPYLMLTEDGTIVLPDVETECGNIDAVSVARLAAFWERGYILAVQPKATFPFLQPVILFEPEEGAKSWPAVQ